MLKRFLSQPVSRLMIIAMVVVAVLPVSFIAIHLYKTAWENSWREIQEKHQLLAENLASPIQIFINNHFDILNLLSVSISSQVNDSKAAQNLFDKSFVTLHGFGSLYFVNSRGKIQAYRVADDMEVNQSEMSPYAFAEHRGYLFVKQFERQYLSGIQASPLNLKPTIFMGVPVISGNGIFLGVLLADIRVSVIETLRKNIKFGAKGHSAIVDQNGRVIAHSNPDWMEEMKDLTGLSVIQSMLAGKHGVTEFYSHYLKEDMVAGYASVDGIGWGVMVPQPKSEITAQVNKFMISNYLWAGIGLLLAIIFAWLLSYWITRPINRVAIASQKLLENDFIGDFDYPADHEPYEARHLGYALKSLVRGLQHSRDEVAQLNASLHKKADETSKQLRVANEKLEETVRNDFLTSLVNRRYFEMDLMDILSRKYSETVHLSLLLFDIDNFKAVNDSYGYVSGDAVLTNVARTLESFMRQDDVVARYAGDQFVLRIHCDQHVALSRASQIRDAIEGQKINWRNNVLKVTVSVGVYSEVVSDKLAVDNILHNVDIAMFEAKKNGRNCVQAYNEGMRSVEQLM